jgi:hypothetical protein
MSISAPTMLNPQMTMEEKMKQSFAKGFSAKDDWSAYKTSHPCWSSFVKISECFSSLCSDACMIHESELPSSNPRCNEVHQQHCFFQCLEQLAEKLIISHEKMFKNKKALFKSDPSLLVAKPETVTNTNQLYMAGSMKGKYDYLASNRPCAKYFSVVTDALLFLSNDACDQVEYRCELTGNEILDNLQREILFFQILCAWTNSKSLERLECLKTLKEKPQQAQDPLEKKTADPEISPSAISPPLMTRPQAKEHQTLDFLADVANSENPWKDYSQPTKKQKLIAFWDFFDETFPNEQTDFVVSILNHKSQEYCVLYSYGLHFANQWMAKRTASLRKPSGEVVISGRRCKGTKIPKGSVIPDNSLIKLNCHSKDYPKTFFIVWNPANNFSTCPALTYCDSECPNSSTCPAR